jgi:hypothetical protein
MAASEKIHQLKLLIGGLEDPNPREFLAAPNLPQGVPRGIIVELVGPQKTEWLIQFLKLQQTNAEFKTFWAERDQKILPTALHQRGLDLTRITFGTFGDDLVIPVRRILQSQLYHTIIAPQKFDEIRVLKAFQLLSEKSNSILFLLGEKKPSNAWPISLQLQIQKKPPASFHVEVLRQKHGNLNEDSHSN